MSWYRNSCSPHDVQRNQGQSLDFAKAQKLYEDTVPLRGKRKDQNIRPLHRRDRSWERVIKVSDTEYYITFDAYQHRQHHNRAISWSLNNDMEYMTIHTPRKMWGQDPSKTLNPREFSSSSTFWFYDFNLPDGFNMVNYHANKYVRYNEHYYFIEKGDIRFQRKVGDTEWKPLLVQRQFKHTIDRKKTKELREAIKPFMEYYDLMCDMVETKWEYGNPIIKGLVGDNRDVVEVKPKEVMAMFKPNQDGSVHDGWLKMVEMYRHRLTSYKGEHHKYLLQKRICDDLFPIMKPCNITEVPLGKMINDRYKHWYR
mgnify:CR=1 FL=1